jgi:hypothetical protein
MDDRFEVAVAAGTMRSASSRAVRFPHRWTPEGITVEADSPAPTFSTSQRPAACSTTCTARPPLLASGSKESACPRQADSTPAHGNLRASVIPSMSVLMPLPTKLLTCSRSLTRSPRSHVLSGPEPRSGGRPNSSLADERTVPQTPHPQRHVSVFAGRLSACLHHASSLCS